MTDTREQHEKIVPYNNHNSDPYHNREEWEADSFPRGAADPDYIGYPGQPDEVSTKPIVYLDFMQPLAGEDEVEKVPVYEEAADTE